MSTQTAVHLNVDPSDQRPAGRRRSRLAPAIIFTLVPGLLALAVFFGLPIIDLIRTSLSRWSGLGERQFIGLENFQRIFAEGELARGLGNSIVLALGATIGICLFATILAAMISGSIRGSAVYRVIWFLPAIAPPSAVAVFWSLAVQPHSGVVNSFLGAIGLGDTHAWLADPNTAIWVVIAVAIWQGVGFAFLIILGAMEEVPVSVYEAAALDGASPVRQFFSVTLPLVRPVLSMVALLEAIWAFNGFTLVWGMTKGGPGDATAILPVQIYREAFQLGDFGPAAAMSIIGGVILLGVGFVGQWAGSRKGADE